MSKFSEQTSMCLELCGFMLLVGATFLIIAPLTATAGAAVGWITGLFWGETITHTLAGFGVTDVKPWQLGCLVGFVGAFMKTSVSTRNTKI